MKICKKCDCINEDNKASKCENCSGDLSTAKRVTETELIEMHKAVLRRRRKIKRIVFVVLSVLFFVSFILACIGVALMDSLEMLFVFWPLSSLLLYMFFAAVMLWPDKMSKLSQISEEIRLGFRGFSGNIEPNSFHDISLFISAIMSYATAFISIIICALVTIYLNMV